MIYEAVEWHSPFAMARDLVRKHRDNSTVRAMVANHFGHSPEIDTIQSLRDQNELAAKAKRRRFGDLYYHRSIDFSNDDHELAMTSGSRQLAEAISAARQA